MLLQKLLLFSEWQYNLQESRGAVMDLSHVAPELSPQMDERRFHEEEDYGDGGKKKIYAIIFL